jgi:hemolysin D
MAVGMRPSLVCSQGRWSLSPELLELPPRPAQEEAVTGATQPSGKPAYEPKDVTSKVVKLRRRNNMEREFLPAALEIIDTPPSPVGRAVGLGIIAMVVAALIWACLGQIDIIATASGRIISEGKTKVIQPIETGMVATIRVADSDHVKAGDVLIELDGTQVEADRDRFARDLLQARLDLARLNGLAKQITDHSDGTEPDLIDPPKEANATDLALARAAMMAQAAQQSAKVADLDQQVAGKQSEAAEADATIEKLQASLPMVQGQEQVRRDLKDKEYGNKLAWYQANQQLIEQTHEITVQAQHKRIAESAERALNQQRVATIAEYQVGTLQDLDKVRAQVSELQAELTKAADRVRQSTLIAPISGTVQQLAVHTIGGVVTPAEALMSIVPDQDKLIVEAMVQNKDVGFIHAGQIVRVKVDTFNFTRYGLINGKVLDVTRDAVSQNGSDKTPEKDSPSDDGSGLGSDPTTAPIYITHIALETNMITTEAGPTKLEPGMQVSAEIQTGQRRVIEYLLSPLVRHASESMRER